MFKKITIYIVFFQFKYLLNFLFILLGLIWISQILRLVDLKFSLTNQIFDIMGTTFLVLPSYLNPLLPILLLISFFYFNFNLNSSNESLIINQYLNNKNKTVIAFIVKIILIFFYFFNYEYLSPKFYEIYKLKELDIRNNFKIGIPSSNEFHIGEDLSIFFKTNDDNQFSDVEALILKDNQFVKSKKAYIEYDKFGFNIIFNNGIRIKMNKNEKSKTTFEKFTYNIAKTNIERLLLDKEHFNTLELLENNQKDYRSEGHKRIVQYLIFLVLIFLSNKIIYKNINKKLRDFKNIFLFIFLILIYLLNSFLIYELNSENINLFIYYLLSILGLFLFGIYILKMYDIK